MSRMGCAEAENEHERCDCHAADEYRANGNRCQGSNKAFPVGLGPTTAFEFGRQLGPLGQPRCHGSRQIDDALPHQQADQQWGGMSHKPDRSGASPEDKEEGGLSPCRQQCR